MSLGTIGKYEKLDVLGHGSSGIVYLAWDKLIGRHVALKEISLQASDEKRFLEEARVLDRLRHPNIVQVNSVDRVEGHLLIDMEYVRGTNLHEHLRANGKLPVREALSIAVQVSDALDFAHRNHTLHRDVKPANILINRDGVAKIVDFGLAEILGSGSYAGGAGTYAYMAPEDFDPEDRSDYRSDIWAAGVTTYEMLIGQRPFQAPKAKDPFSWKLTVEEDIPPPICEIGPWLPRELQNVMDLALAKDKRNRYQSAGELRDDLKSVLSLVGGETKLTGISGVCLTGGTGESALEERHAASVENLGIEVSPTAVDFGRVRKGDAVDDSLFVRVPGRGRIQGRVASQPGWIAVEPQSFERRKQKLELTADTETIWRPGVYEEPLVLDVEGKAVCVPLTMEMLPRRRSFAEAAWWYVPLLLLSLLPLVSEGIRDSRISPAALVSVGLLSVMLFIIAVVADLGTWEKVIPGIAGAIGLGAMVGTFWTAYSAGQPGGLFSDLHVPIIGSLLCLFMVLQLLTASKWRMWAVMQALFAIGVNVYLMR